MNRIIWLLLLPAIGFGAGGLDRLYFEPNWGQSGGQIRYLARTEGAVTLISDDGIVLRGSTPKGDVNLFVTWEGSGAASEWQTSQAIDGVTSYFIGNQADKWLRGVPHFGRITRRNVYPGIDLAIYGSAGKLEYDFIIAPGADPENIRVRFTGNQDLAVDAEGNLLITLPGARVIQRKPVLYETAADGSRLPIQGAYRLLGKHRAAFLVRGHNPRNSLTIDPVLESATLLGGSGNERTVASDPRVAIVGTTDSTDFPGTSGSHRGTHVFIYIPAEPATIVAGGTGDDVATCAVFGSTPGSPITIGGYTNSRDFPIIPAQGYNGFYPLALQSKYGGGEWDGFVIAFNYTSRFSTPAFSTYAGGSGDDRVLSVVDTGYAFLAVAGSTTSTDFPLANAWQKAPGGGVDGFLQVISGRSLLTLSTYLGGSGNDRALALALSPSATDLYIAGETRSVDWQPPAKWSGARSGDSDGFLLHAITDVRVAGVAPQEGTYFGGSGDDRFTALVLLPNGNVAAAGVTSSQDLPVSGGPQNAYGGGESDAFVAQFLADLTPRAGTYLGGSGAEEALSLSTNRFNELLAGGWTTSGDFPVTSGMESSCGKGGEDGFIVHLDSTGQRIFSTCYGGSGADRITSVISDDAQNVYFAGFSTSSDLTLKNPVQSLNAGSADVFYGSFIIPAIHAEGLSVGQDLAGALSVGLGDSSNFIGVTLTATSSDASNVRLAVRPDDPGQTSVSISIGTAGNAGTRSFFAFCLTGSAVVPVTLSAPGYPSRTVNVRCVPSGLVLGRTEFGQSGGGSIAILPSALDPDTLRPIAVQNPRGGLDPIRIDVSNPNPDLLTFGSASITIDQFSAVSERSFGFSVKASGNTQVSFSTPSGFAFVPTNLANIAVSLAPRVTGAYIPRLARNLMGRVSVSMTSDPGPNAIIPITLTSSDPSKVLISDNPGQHGRASLTVNYSNYFRAWLEVVDTGDVSITFSSPGIDPITVPVPFGEMVAGFTYDNSTANLERLELLVEQSQDLKVRLAVNPAEYPYYGQNPQVVLRPDAAPIQLELRNSNTAVTSTPSSFPVVAVIPGGSLPSGSFHLDAKSAGTAVYSIATTSTLVRNLGPMNVVVTRARIVASPITVGANLATSLQVTLVGKTNNDPVTMTFTSSDPSKVLLSPDGQTAGQASVTLPVQYQYGAVWLYGLSDSGEATITASADGFGNTTATVTLAPSGFAWSSPTFRLPSDSPPSVSAYALDPASFAPLLSPQKLRPGVSATVDLEISDPRVANLPQRSFTFPGAISPGSVAVPMTVAAGGETQVTIVQPSGFVRPAGGGILRVRAITPLYFYMYPAGLGRNLQAPITLQWNRPNVETPPPITVTSSDPRRLLVSTNSSILGSVSAIANYRNGSYAPIYLQAMDGPADVQITLSSPGVLSFSSSVSIFSTALVFANPGTSFQLPDGTLIANTQQDLTLSVYPVALDDVTRYGGGSPDNRTLRPGIDSMALTINSSNPAVASVPTPPILNSLTNRTDVTVKPLAPGKTDLTLLQPAGFVVPPRSLGRTLHLTVNGPSFVLTDLTLGRNLQLGVGLQVQNGSSQIPNDVDVTLTSADPSRVLLSAGATTVGSDVLILHYARGASVSRTLYVQALDQTGDAAISISAPGYATTTAKVRIVPLAFLTDNRTLSATLQGNAATRVRPVPVVTGNTNFYSGGDFRFRPGFPGVSLAVSSSNPTVATISPSVLTWGAGDFELSLAVHPVAPGSTTVSFTAPDPYIAPADVSVTISGGNLSISSSPLVLGKDLIDRINISGDNFYTNSVRVTVSTSDVSRVLVSNSPASPGLASADVVSQQGQQVFVYVHALADAGTVTLNFSAPGYRSATTQVQLSKAAVVFATSTPVGTLTPLSAPVEFKARLQATPPAAVYYDFSPMVRPGAQAVNVPVSLSDPAIGTLSPAALTFNPGDSVKSFFFQPKAEGTALLSLGVPAGFADPVSQRQQLLTVTQARASFSNPPLAARDLVRPNSLVLATPPAQTLSLTLTSVDPTRLLLSTSANPTGAASVVVTIAAGSTTSGAFNLIALASSGTAALQLTGAPLSLANPDVTLQPSGFIWEQTTASTTANSGVQLTVTSRALTPSTLAPEGYYPLRPGLPPLSISFASSNTAVVAEPAAPVSFYSGDYLERVTVTTKSPGSATLTLQTPAGFATPSSGTAINITVR